MNKQDIDEIADIAAFHQAMRDVVPLKKTSASVIGKAPARHRYRTKITQSYKEEASCALVPSEYCSKIEPNDFLFEADSSLSHKVLRKFKQGQYNPEATLDLHGFTTNEAALALDSFIQKSLERRFRVLLVIHGKGAQGILKTQVNYWLKGHSHILAFCSAKPKDGGLGAVYLLLKKRTSTGDHYGEK